MRSLPEKTYTPALLLSLLAVFTDGLFHFRQRYALEIGETVVNGLRADIFRKAQRQPMSFFQRVKIGRIIGRVTSDVEALRVGIQDVLFVSAIQGGQMVFSAIVIHRSSGFAISSRLLPFQGRGGGRGATAHHAANARLSIRGMLSRDGQNRQIVVACSAAVFPPERRGCTSSRRPA